MQPISINTTNSSTEKYIERLAEALDIPASRYEAAERSYLSVGDWLDRDGSSLKGYSPKVYIQGSFRLGTTIRPVNDDEHYDIDLVCELNLQKESVTQAEVKQMLAKELRAYASAHGMQQPLESRRCWTLEYADGAQFHLDALPAIPDGTGKRLRLQASGLTSEWTNSALAITDNESEHYHAKSANWPNSNPVGFSEWFKSRMNQAFLARRSAMANEIKASVEDIPEHTVKTPLQAVVQLLKRHRDLMFADRTDAKPISIIITTLAGRAYSNETTISKALENVLNTMHVNIEDRNGVKWVANPTDPQENFADRWEAHPERYDAFCEWLAAARRDFLALFGQLGGEELILEGTKWAGAAIAKRAFAATKAISSSSATTIFRDGARALNAFHKQSIPWPTASGGAVTIERVTYARKGTGPRTLSNNAAPLPKNASLRFKARTNIDGPFQVYWQVVNTGDEAITARCLRGQFETGSAENGEITHNESTLYKGSHTIECFIVKHGYLVARSGVFIVNIA